MKLPAEPPAESIVALVDSREKLPFLLHPLQTQEATLQTGDYSLKGMERLVAVERKSLPDLVSCVGPERDRFERELERIRAFPHKLLAVEGSWEEIELARWRSNVTAASVRGSLLSWMADGLPVILAERNQLQLYVARWLYLCFRRRWRELRVMASEIQVANA